MSVTDRATDRPARNSPGKATTRTIRPAVADGPPLAQPGVSSATSSSTMAKSQASFASEIEFFNGLLDDCPEDAADCGRQRHGQRTPEGHAHCRADYICPSR